MGEPKETVFLVDDDPSVLRGLRRLLTAAGFEVVAFESPREFLEHHDALAPGCLVLDLAMPGVNGMQLQQQLAASGSTLPIVFLTGHGDVPTSVQAMKRGAADFLTKPVDSEKLRAVLSLHAGRPEMPVLVVEDDPDSREMLVRVLRKEGYVVTEAENGSVALERIAEQRPELILLDLMMPVMDGFEFLSILAAQPQLASIPVIVVTAKDLTPADRDVLNGSVREVFQKGAMKRENLLHDVCALVAKTVKHP